MVRGSGNDPAVHIMLLLGPTMQIQLLHLSGGRELWDELEEQFGL
jgi:hypothetical protein